MTSPSTAENAFRNRCLSAARTLAPCVGYFIDRISFNAFGPDDALDISLVGGPSMPDVLISLSRLHHLSVAKPPDLSGSFVDEVSLVHLPALPHAWPGDVDDRVRRFEGLPELAWLRLHGPAEVDAIASAVTVYTA
ncbi:hypothetical protein [Streptomyces sp. HPF1205]|uniref:hypothetical protein n=1 Tax=Streptomyces sp. HPF1205 TaxID=2873262 RepID=UPI001CEC72C6|nr:hypothetical protein [Streptomyces sp. HPF1205]